MSSSTAHTTEQQQQQQHASPNVLLPSWTEKDMVELPVSQFLPLLTSFDDYQDMLSHVVLTDATYSSIEDDAPPARHLVQELKISGGTRQRQQHVQFEFEFRVSVLVDQYNTCPLLSESSNDRLTVIDTRVQQLSLNNNNNKNNKSGITASSSNDHDDTMQVLPNYFDNERSSLQQQQQQQQKQQSTLQSIQNGGGSIGLFDGHHSLITRNKGLYSVTLTVSVPFLSSQQKGVRITFPSESIAARTKLSNFVIEGDMQALVQPSTSIHTRVVRLEESKNKKNDPSYENGDDDDDDLDPSFNTHETIISECVMPSTTCLTIYWTRNEVKQVEQDQDKEENKVQETKEQKPLIVNVDQNVLHSVGGGIVSSSTEFNFQILNGSYDTFYVAINVPKNKSVRVLRVDGRNIKKWEMKKVKGTSGGLRRSGSETSLSTATSDTMSSPTLSSSLSSVTGGGEQSICKIILETGVEGSYQLKLFTELDMDRESAKVYIPTFSCLNVNREKGFIGIEATSSVEIKELSNRGLTKVDTRELPPELTNKASDQLIFGYKFLQSKGNSLYIDVKKHDDVAVLVAVIEEAYYEVTYSQSGHYLYHVVLKVKNTTQDYIKTKLISTTDDSIPQNVQCSLWSSTVGGKSTRPAKDKDGNILIPLKRSAAESQFTVELFYLYSNGKMIKDSGDVELYFPVFNTPITRAYYSIHLPVNFNYGEFEGDLKEAKRWEKSPSVLNFLNAEKSANESTPFGAIGGGFNRNVQMMNAMPQQQQYMPQMQQMQQPRMPQLNAAPRRQARRFDRRGSVNEIQEENDELEDYEDDMMFDSDEDIDDEDEEEEEEEGGEGEQETTTTVQTSSVLGVLPINLTSVPVGKQFLFEKLLVSETEPSLRVSVQFKQVEKSWRDKRSLLRQDIEAWLTGKTIFGTLFLLLVALLCYIIYLR